ncbi:hypothetical protein B0I37DRAFT_381642 [Chaetomium sp. MPI-CAGE-AT-0009]|nr:hypothetical protein B0I37DRAFT_381642 [Chaetomium sp. MPI-CAGE-AT-0009]
MSSDSSDVTPVPYQPGRPLNLQILRLCGDLSLSQSVTVRIIRVLSMTMSPVMTVSIKTQSGSEYRVILKLYDRRFGRNFREILGKHAPHTAADEVAFQSFVRQGKMAPFLRVLEHNKKTADIAVPPYRYHDSTGKGKAKSEAALWQEGMEHFECETEAYAQLRDFQGKLIPHMYAHVCIAASDLGVPADLLQPQTAPYFEVRGVLLERIDGYRLWDIAAASELAPTDPEEWLAIIQAAADAAHRINQRGVIMEDCAPRNVVVDMHLQKPFIIDLAQCLFKDKMVKRWLENGYADDDDDWDPEEEYWERVAQHNNPAAISSVMRTRVLRQKGIELDMKFLDHDKIIAEVRRANRKDQQG